MRQMWWSCSRESAATFVNRRQCGTNARTRINGRLCYGGTVTQRLPFCPLAGRIRDAIGHRMMIPNINPCDSREKVALRDVFQDPVPEPASPAPPVIQFRLIPCLLLQFGGVGAAKYFIAPEGSGKIVA